MGRGNVCTHYECEGLFYLDRDLLDVYCKTDKCECGHVKGPNYDEEPKTARELYNAGIEYSFDGTQTGWMYSQFDSEDNWRQMIEIMREKFIKRFLSFYREDKWIDNDRHVVLENGLFRIAIVDNEWSAAWLLLERTDIDDTGSNRTFMRRHYQTYLEEIKRILIDVWGEAIGYGGAWVSGRKYTREDVKSAG